MPPATCLLSAIGDESMNRSEMPGLTAEASLYKSHQIYWTSSAWAASARDQYSLSARLPFCPDPQHICGDPSEPFCCPVSHPICCVNPDNPLATPDNPYFCCESNDPDCCFK